MAEISGPIETHQHLFRLRQTLERAAFTARECANHGYRLSWAERRRLRRIEADLWEIRDAMLSILGTAADNNPKAQERKRRLARSSR